MELKRLESFVFEKMAESRLPGLSLALVKDGDLLYARGFGQRDLEQGFPATPETLYSIGSVTKSFTALAIMQLAERGLLDITDPINRHLPFDIEPKGEPVRLEHLLAHTSGIPALAYSEAVMAYANGTGGRPLPIAGPEDVLTFMADAGEWVESRPGERWAYSNEGYALLGLIVERVSGKPYEDYIRDEILRPLGMTRSFFTRRDVENDADVAVPYVLPDSAIPRPGRYLYRRIRSEGGLISNVSDLARYLNMWLGQSTPAPISLERRTAMMQPRVPLPQLDLRSAGESQPVQHYGFGLTTEDFFGEPLVGHGGNVLVSTAHIAFLPESGVGVAVLANGGGYPLAQVARFALAVARGHDPRRLPALVVADALSRLCGNYRTYQGTMSARVVRQGDFLKFLVGSRSKPEEVILVPEDLDGEEQRFFTFTEGRRLPVSFRQRGQVIELLYERYKFRRDGPLA